MLNLAGSFGFLVSWRRAQDRDKTANYFSTEQTLFSSREEVRSKNKYQEVHDKKGSGTIGKPDVNNVEPRIFYWRLSSRGKKWNKNHKTQCLTSVVCQDKISGWRRLKCSKFILWKMFYFGNVILPHCQGLGFYSNFAGSERELFQGLIQCILDYLLSGAQLFVHQLQKHKPSQKKIKPHSFNFPILALNFFQSFSIQTFK